MVALAFEGGPDVTIMPNLLDALSAAGVPASFFIDGR
jgi:peptidoglycan/xylan/chitin deacetylase (PgdA/CDA1 family)